MDDISQYSYTPPRNYQSRGAMMKSRKTTSLFLARRARN
jgi:hypothetical protein